MRYALIRGGQIATVVEQDTAPTIPGQWVACGDAGPGFGFDGVVFSPPRVTLSAAEFLSRLTVDEEADIARAAADTPVGNPSARLAQARHRVRLRRINAKQLLRLDDDDVIAFLAALQTDGLLTPERVTEILE